MGPTVGSGYLAEPVTLPGTAVGVGKTLGLAVVLGLGVSVSPMGGGLKVDTPGMGGGVGMGVLG